MNRREERILKRIKKNLEKKLKNRLVSFYAFGSRVRGDHELWSDFDVLIVVKNRTPEVEHKIMDIFVQEELKSSIFFTPLIKDNASFELEKKYNSPFYQNILKEGILI